MLTTLKNREDNLQDVLGLTPLHMFALSQHRNLEVCIRLLSFDIHAVTTKGELFDGELPIVCACRTNAPTEIVRLLLQAQCAIDPPERSMTTNLDTDALIGLAIHASGPNSCETLQYLTLHQIESRLNELGHEPWQELVRSTVHQIPDIATRLEQKRQVEVVMSTLELYEHKKSLSFLEQALWKSQIDEWKKHDQVQSSQLEEADRWNCRINCGDEIVISNVLPFLG